MAKPKPSRDGKYYYECVMTSDLLYVAPAIRKDQMTGPPNKLRAPMINHPLRVNPSRGWTPRGEPLAPDYIATERPLAHSYTEEVVKQVSRPSKDDPLNPRARVMRAKVSKIKFRVLEEWEVTAEIRRMAWDYDWSPMMFEDKSADVRLPDEPVPVEAK